ncbi:MAG TPA: hypothetical protein VGM06_24315 [Polyangiaceae bacterium]|jgi:hypothetical protein
MGALETVARIVELAGAPDHAAHIAEMRALFEERTGAFAPEDAWFEERFRAFWCDAVTRAKFGRAVEGDLAPEERGWLQPLERAHRGLFRAEGRLLVDVWSGAELAVTVVEDVSGAELEASAGQLFDARVVARVGATGGGAAAGSNTVAGAPLVAVLLPGALFHPRDAAGAIDAVLAAGRARALSTDHVLDALMRMERALRSLSRVKAGYAYRAEALDLPAAPAPVRKAARGLP